MNADQLAHLLKQFAGQQMIDFRPLVYGHIAQYDPNLHRIRAIIPSLRDDDPAPVLSPWMPLGSMMVGAGWGIQVAPVGGATIEQPTAGEQVLIGLFDRQRGVCACLGMTFNGVQQPPSTVLGTPLLPGEMVLFNQSGTFIRTHNNGDLETVAMGDVSTTVADGKSATTTCSGSAVLIDGSGNIVLTQTSGANVIIPGLPSSPPAGGPTGTLYLIGTGVNAKP